MSFTEKYLDQFVHSKDRQNPETFRKGRFFIVSIFLFVSCGIPGMIYSFIFQPQMVLQNGIIATVLSSMVLLFLLYRKFNKRILFVNILAFFMISANISSTFMATGGIYSSDNAWLTVLWCWAFLVANKLSGFIWFGISLTLYTFLFYAEMTAIKDYEVDFLSMSPDYIYINYFFAAVFIAIILYLHEQGKEKYFRAVMAAKAEIEQKSKELESQKKDIVSSINYAKRIQYAVLPDVNMIYKKIPQSFILYKPKDIVSGDFFWFKEIDEHNYILVCADCTGHGVPGAFMTVIGSNLLNQIVSDSKVIQPSEILLVLDKKITATLNQEKNTSNFVQDGMDLSLLKVNKKSKELVFTSAKRPAIFIRDQKIEELVGSKSALGGMTKETKKFEEIKINYQENDLIYLFTDGYPDQFGGQENRKFMIKRFRELLLDVHLLDIAEQKEKLDQNISQWIGNHKQTDDITVMGIKF